MKRIVLGLVAAAALILVPASAKADHDWDDHRHGHHGRHGWNDGYRGDWGGSYHGGYRGGHDCYQRPPRVVYRPAYPAYGYGYGGYGTSFYYNGPNAAFGFGF